MKKQTLAARISAEAKKYLAEVGKMGAEKRWKKVPKAKRKKLMSKLAKMRWGKQRGAAGVSAANA